MGTGGAAGAGSRGQGAVKDRGHTREAGRREVEQREVGQGDREAERMGLEREGQPHMYLWLGTAIV